MEATEIFAGMGRGVVQFLEWLLAKLTGAGWSTWAVILGGMVLLALLLSILSLFLDKWEGDFRHKAMIFVGFVFLFLFFFLGFLWLHVNHYEPLVKLAGAMFGE